MGNFPTGKPEKDVARLGVWWEEELRDAGLNGEVQVEYFSYDDPTSDWDWKETLLSMLDNSDQLKASHMYIASIPWAPWPMDTAIFTTKKGLITFIIYSIKFSKKIDGELQYIKALGTWKQVHEFQGTGAEELNQNKALVKTLDKSLSFMYQSLFSTYRIDTASYSLTPVEDGTEVIVTTTVRGTPAFVKKRLGLKVVIGGLQALEAAL